MSAQPPSRLTEVQRAIVLHDRPLVVDLIELTLNHGVFQVRAARDLAESEAILAEWQPHLAVVDRTTKTARFYSSGWPPRTA